MAKKKVEVEIRQDTEPESTSIFIYKGVVFSNAEFVKRVIDENPYIKENWELLLSIANTLYNNPFTITDKSADLFDLVKNPNLPKSLEGKKEFLENFAVFWNLSVLAHGTFPNSVFAGLDKPLQKAIERNGKALEKLRENKYSEMPLHESPDEKKQVINDNLNNDPISKENVPNASKFDRSKWAKYYPIALEKYNKANREGRPEDKVDYGRKLFDALKESGKFDNLTFDSVEMLRAINAFNKWRNPKNKKTKK